MIPKSLPRVHLKRIFIAIILVCFIVYVATSLLHNPSLNQDLASNINDFKERINLLEKNLDKNKEKVLLLERLLSQQHIDNSNNKINNNALNHEDKIGVLVMACNRPSVQFHVEQLFKYRKYNENKFPIVVSQDCAHKQTKSAILGLKDQLYDFIEQPDQGDVAEIPRNQAHMMGYYKISRHYKWALDQMFLKHKFESVIITEDDLNIATDFFQYFEKMNEILKQDETLFCVSAWNDNGKKDCIKNDPELVHRTDFFPGLGWMLTRQFWLEISEKWPKAFWDDWLRNVEQRKERSCIRPEISRTEMSSKGKMGVSNGQFFDTYLQYIVLNVQPVDWLRKDVSYLLKSNYDERFDKEVNAADVADIDAKEFTKDMQMYENKYPAGSKVRLKYTSKKDFIALARLFGIMIDFKAGVPRTAYKGVVRVLKNSREYFLVPSQSPWKGYDVTW